MKLNQLSPAPGSKKDKKRVGRGRGSGQGCQAGRGRDGQKSRSGKSKMPAWFEGGQMPLQRRLPKFGFTNIFRKEVQIINLSSLAKLKDNPKADIAALYEAGLIKYATKPVKILGNGEIDFAIDICANAVSASANEKITKAGGKVTIL